jgi:hypothetical protein
MEIGDRVVIKGQTEILTLYSLTTYTATVIWISKDGVFHEKELRPYILEKVSDFEY